MRTVIFDFDLTLVDSVSAITRGLNKMAEHFDLPRVTEADTRRVMSLEAGDLWASLWGRYDPAWNDYFLSVVAKQEKDYLDLVPGARELLAKIKDAGLGLALATNRDNAWGALGSIGLASFFDTAVGSGDVPRGKPAPDMLLMVMDQMGADPSQTIYVGDAVFDMQAARRAGIRGVGLLEGGTPREDLVKAGAWRVRDSLSDLGDIIGIV